MAVTAVRAENAMCPICGKPLRQSTEKPQLLYNRPVCRKCSYEFASRRRCAFLIDFILYWFILVGLGIIPANTPNEVLASAAECISCPLGAGVSAQGAAAQTVSLWLLIGFLLKDGFSGRSPGKAIMGLRVIKEKSGSLAGFLASFLRNLPLCIPFAVLVVANGLRRGNRAGDRWAGTTVIWEKYRDKEPFAVEEDAWERLRRLGNGMNRVDE